MENMLQKIEELVIARQHDKLDGLLCSWRKAVTTPEMLQRYYDWLRRLGYYREILNDIDFSTLLKVGARDAFQDIQIAWAAHVFCLLGNNEFAYQLAVKMDPALPIHREIIARIYLLTGRHGDASRIWFEMYDNKAPISRTDCLNYLSWCHALLGEERFTEAEEKIRMVISLSPDSAVSANALCALGENLCYQGRFSEAISALEKSLELLPEKIDNIDTLLAKKWYGWALAHHGKREMGIRLIREVHEVFYQSKRRPEAWLQPLSMLRILGEKDIRCEMIEFYPGLRPHKQWWGVRPFDVTIGAPDNKFNIELDVPEYYVDGVISLTTPKELLLLGLIRSGHPWGVPRERLKALLWQGELFSYSQMDMRLDSLVTRLRNQYGIGIISEDSWLKIDQKTADQVSFSTNEYPLIVREFSKEKNLDHRKLMEKYRCSRASAFRYIKKIKELGKAG